jgi:4-hydroxy-4-methyl-2-oxoglutarate aldolase
VSAEALTEADQSGGFGSATLHEAAGRAGALPETIRPIRPGMRVVGTALPVHCPAGDNLWLHRAVYAARPGEVLVCAVDDPSFGYWGEILAVAAQERGIAGLVIDGGVRDTEQLDALGFATFSAAVAIRGTGKDPSLKGAVGEAVVLGDVEIARGDLVVGDADGVVVIPAGRIDEVRAASREREDEEAAIMARLREGATTIDLLDLPKE